MSAETKKAPAYEGPWAGDRDYRYGGPCTIGGCEELVHYLSGEEGHWIQHGENAEHRQFLDWAESSYAWLLRVHEYESQPHIPGLVKGGS